MKQLLIISILLLSSCCKVENNINTDCIQMEQNSDFFTEDLNQEFTIEFPKDFTGKGLDSTSFISFRKEKGDKITFYYTFNSDIGPSLYYGQKLTDPIPQRLESPSQLLTENLPLKKNFCIDGKIVGILYYSLNGVNSTSHGKLYLEHDDWYYEALKINFSDMVLKEEIFEILKTIKKK